jgi:hypothetical protein
MNVRLISRMICRGKKEILLPYLDLIRRMGHLKQVGLLLTHQLIVSTWDHLL